MGSWVSPTIARASPTKVRMVVGMEMVPIFKDDMMTWHIMHIIGKYPPNLDQSYFHHISSNTSPFDPIQVVLD